MTKTTLLLTAAGLLIASKAQASTPFSCPSPNEFQANPTSETFASITGTSSENQFTFSNFNNFSTSTDFSNPDFTSASISQNQLQCNYKTQDGTWRIQG